MHQFNKCMKSLLTATAVLLLFTCKAQTSQQTITYNVQVENSPVASAMGDMKLIIYYKNGKSLTDMHSAMYSMKSLVTDTGTVILVNAMGQKYFFKTPALGNISGSDSAALDVTYVDETKEIAGYTCKKALVKVPSKMSEDNDTAVFWYTDKLPVIAMGKEAAIFKGLKGMPLEYEMTSAQMKLKLTAQSVSTGNIPESTFQLSTEGYSPLDENLMKQLQQ